MLSFFVGVCLKAGPTIPDDKDGHLAYKLGDVIESDMHKCKLSYIHALK